MLLHVTHCCVNLIRPAPANKHPLSVCGHPLSVGMLAQTYHASSTIYTQAHDATVPIPPTPQQQNSPTLSPLRMLRKLRQLACSPASHLPYGQLAPANYTGEFRPQRVCAVFCILRGPMTSVGVSGILCSVPGGTGGASERALPPWLISNRMVTPSARLLPAHDFWPDVASVVYTGRGGGSSRVVELRVLHDVVDLVTCGEGREWKHWNPSQFVVLRRARHTTAPPPPSASLNPGYKTTIL